jgi:hypothetical protein
MTFDSDSNVVSASLVYRSALSRIWGRSRRFTRAMVCRLRRHKHSPSKI